MSVPPIARSLLASPQLGGPSSQKGQGRRRALSLRSDGGEVALRGKDSGDVPQCVRSCLQGEEGLPRRLPSDPGHGLKEGAKALGSQVSGSGSVGPKPRRSHAMELDSPGGGGLQHHPLAAVARDERPAVGLLADG